MLLAFLSVLANPASSAFTTTGSTVILNDIAYYIPGTSVATVNLNGGRIWPGWGFGNKNNLGEGLVPMTVVSGPSGFDAQAVANALGAADDVWQSGFLEGKFMPIRHCTRGLTLLFQSCMSNITLPFGDVLRLRCTTLLQEPQSLQPTVASSPPALTSSTPVVVLYTRLTVFTPIPLELSPRQPFPTPMVLSASFLQMFLVSISLSPCRLVLISPRLLTSLLLVCVLVLR